MTMPMQRPPYSEDAEQAVLAAMLIDQDAMMCAFGIVDEGMFYAEKHRHLFSAMVYLAECGTTVDPMTLSDRLTTRGVLDRAGGKDYIGFLVDAVPTSANVEYHAKIVKEKAQLRGLAAMASTLSAEATRGELSSLELARHAAQSLLPFTVDDVDAPGFVRMKDSVWPTMELIEAQASGKVFGLRTGYARIDNETGGFQPGELVILGGAEKMGKSVAAINIGLRIATRHPDDGGGGVAYVSAEMTKTAIVKRSLGITGKIEQRRLRNGKLIDTDWPRLANAGGKLSALPFWIDDEAEPSLSDVVARCTALKAQHPELVAVVVDFLQLVHDREKGIAESVELKRIAYGLKRMAKRLSVVVFAPCQLNTKQIEDLKEPRPRLKDLQGSSGMRQAADFICLLYRPSFYDSLDADPYAIEFNFAAAREASPFVAHLRWDSQTLSIDETHAGITA
jgi:replicative DNA helicase